MSEISNESSSYFYINEPAIDMRLNPTYDSQIVSQALLSEKIEVQIIIYGLIKFPYARKSIGILP